jgi:PhnB protein
MARGADVTQHDDVVPTPSARPGAIGFGTLTPMEITGAYVSFTEVTPDGHDAYNRWHLFDHLPEQYRLPGIAHGQRWAVTSVLAAEPPLDRVHYVTLYLLTEPFEENVQAFWALGRELADAGRFDDHRVSHLNGALRIRDRRTAPANPLDPRAVPFAPHRSVRVVLDGTDAGLDAAVGTWTFDGVDTIAGRTLTVTWSEAFAREPPEEARGRAAFDAVLATIDPFDPTPNRRPGHHTVTPRIIVDDPAAQVAFLRDAFGATGDVPDGRPAEVRFGDSLLLVSDGGGLRDRQPAFLYVYVDDVDAVHERAVAAGAETVEAPLETPYGDRRATVRDPFGNVFQIAAHGR